MSLITEQELHEAIAECQGQRNPNANTCIKLASYYTILDHLLEADKEIVTPRYSFASGDESKNTITYQSGSEFSDAVYGKDAEEIMSIVDELMDTLSVLNPPLYKSVMRRVTE